LEGGREIEKMKLAPPLDSGMDAERSFDLDQFITWLQGRMGNYHVCSVDILIFRSQYVRYIV